MKTAFARIVVAAVTVAALAGAALAQGPMADVIKARQAHYKEIGKASKGLHDELAKPDPDVKALQAYAKTIDGLAPQVPSWFPKGSGPEAGVKTAAKAEIWSKPADFKKAADGFAGEAHQFAAVAMTGDVAAIRAENMKLGGACKTCHEQFRARDS